MKTIESSSEREGIRWNRYHVAQNTTHLSDINELSLGYVLNAYRWWDSTARETFNTKCRRLSSMGLRQSVGVQVERGRVMAAAFLAWFPQRTITTVAWVARQKTHPADIMVVFNDETPFGISCKSTNGFGDIGMKNPGVGPLEKLLGLDLKAVVKAAELEMILRYGLPKSADARKAAIRLVPDVLESCRLRGSVVLNEIRDRVLQSLQVRDNGFLAGFLKTSLLDCDETTRPRYIKITGFGNGSVAHPYAAKVHDPFAVDLSGTVTVESAGSNSIIFSHNGHSVCRLRPKFESEPLASTLKFSVDPA